MATVGVKGLKSSVDVSGETEDCCGMTLQRVPAVRVEDEPRASADNQTRRN